MNYSVSDGDMTELHDLIAEIDRNAFKLERDIRNLNNLIHVIKGDGIRFVEFRREGQL
jgi:hypothetical protein